MSSSSPVHLPNTGPTKAARPPSPPRPAELHYAARPSSASATYKPELPSTIQSKRLSGSGDKEYHRGPRSRRETAMLASSGSAVNSRSSNPSARRPSPLALRPSSTEQIAHVPVPCLETGSELLSRPPRVNPTSPRSSMESNEQEIEDSKNLESQGGGKPEPTPRSASFRDALESFFSSISRKKLSTPNILVRNSYYNDEHLPPSFDTLRKLKKPKSQPALL